MYLVPLRSCCELWPANLNDYRAVLTVELEGKRLEAVDSSC